MDSNELNGSESGPVAPNEALLDEAETLIWALLDDNIEAADLKRLEGLLKEHDQVRQQYMNCVQMHVDLQDHFGPGPEAPEMPSSPVLGQLGDIRPGTDTWPPVSE